MIDIQLPPTMYRPCAGCDAPIVSPFPTEWHLALVKEGPRDGPVVAFATPHRPDCEMPVPSPEPGISTRVPGKYVTGLSIQFAGMQLP